MQIVSPPSGIKSVQRGIAVLTSVSSLNVTISSVNLSKSFLSMSCRGGAGASSADQVMVAGKLNTATQLTFNRPVSLNEAVVQWEVIEYA